MLAKAGSNLKLRDLRGHNAVEFAKSRRPIRHHIVRKVNSYLGAGNMTTISSLGPPRLSSLSYLSEKRTFSRTRTRSFVFEQADVEDSEIALSLAASEAHLHTFHDSLSKLTTLFSSPSAEASNLNKTDINGMLCKTNVSNILRYDTIPPSNSDWKGRHIPILSLVPFFGSNGGGYDERDST